MELARKYSRARSNRPWILGSLRDLVDEANRFAQFFGLRSRLSMPADLSAMEAECKAIEKRERERRHAPKLSAQREALERVQHWVDGETDFLCQQSYGPIRLRIKGDELQTSRGRVSPWNMPSRRFGLSSDCTIPAKPMSATATVYTLALSCLTPLTAQGNVTAGCHNVAWEEIERVAILAGVN